MSFFGLDRILSFLQTRNFNRANQDLPSEIQRAINWENSAVAGSFALHQFTGDTNWEPNDVDIMVACQDKDEFVMATTMFEGLSGAKLVKYAWFDEPPPNLHELTRDDELFHESVIGSRTYSFDNYDKPVQLICLQKTERLRNPIEILNKTSDIPACVSYTMHDGEKIFHIPERGREILLTRQGSREGICPSRYEKYLRRGYSFS